MKPSLKDPIRFGTVSDNVIILIGAINLLILILSLITIHYEPQDGVYLDKNLKNYCRSNKCMHFDAVASWFPSNLNCKTLGTFGFFYLDPDEQIEYDRFLASRIKTNFTFFTNSDNLTDLVFGKIMKSKNSSSVFEHVGSVSVFFFGLRLLFFWFIGIGIFSLINICLY